MTTKPQLPGHLRELATTARGDMPPTGVLWVAHGLLGSADGPFESLASVDLDDPTTWTFDIVSNTTLAHAVVTFDRAHYTHDDEADRYGPTPTMKIDTAWARPLRAVTQLDADAEGRTTLTFTPGGTHKLVQGGPGYRPEAVARTDRFYTLLRAGIGF